MKLTRCFFETRKSRTSARPSSVMSNGSATPRNMPPMYIMFDVSTHEIFLVAVVEQDPERLLLYVDVVEVHERAR